MKIGNYLQKLNRLKTTTKILSYQTIQTATDEEFKALTSLTTTEFEELLKGFASV